MIDNLLYIPLMLFLHIVADYCLQGILASMKQKDWWEKQIPGCSYTKYKNDYKAALWAHSYMWAFIITAPMGIATFNNSDCRLNAFYILLVICMSACHYLIDDGKANKKILTLTSDQVMHVIQILSAWLYWTFIAQGW